MPTPTYTPLANLTLSSSAASVTFSSISQSYRDLVLVFNGTCSENTSVRIFLNSDTTGTNYARVLMIGSGTAASSQSNTTNAEIIGDVGPDRSTAIVNFLDYSATDKHKSMLVRNDKLATRAVAARWANTAAITTVQLSMNAGTFDAGSTFALYGIVN